MYHPIDLVPEAQPFKHASRRYSPPSKDAARQQAKELLAAGVIEPSYSPYSSAVVMAKKKDGSLRLCIDFRQLNEQTVKDAFPLPRIDECMAALQKARVFSTLDLCCGFWQIPVVPEDRYKTAFACDGQLWQWVMMPFGLCNAVATFQRMMNQVLASVREKWGDQVLCYVDDVLIATQLWN